MRDCGNLTKDLRAVITSLENKDLQREIFTDIEIISILNKIQKRLDSCISCMNN